MIDFEKVFSDLDIKKGDNVHADDITNLNPLNILQLI